MAIATDVDDGTKAAYDLPPPSKAGAVEFYQDKDGKPIVDGNTAQEEEDLAAMVGWTQRFGWPVESVTEGESLLDHSTWLESKVPDQYFGGQFTQFRPVVTRITFANTNWCYRMVSQRRGYYFCLSLLVDSCGARGWSRLGHNYHGWLFNLLPNIDQTSAKKPSRRHYPGDGAEEVGQ